MLSTMKLKKITHVLLLNARLNFGAGRYGNISLSRLCDPGNEKLYVFIYFFSHCPNFVFVNPFDYLGLEMTELLRN